MKKLYLCLISCFIYFSLFSQTEVNISLFAQIQNLDYRSSKANGEKLKSFYLLKNKIETTNPLNDSAYILVLVKISKYEFLAQNNFEVSLNFAKAALNECTRLKNEKFKGLKLNCYYNLASSYQQLLLYSNAIAYYDTVISLCNNNFIDTNYYQLDAHYNKADIYFFLGDYQKAIDESEKGIFLSSKNNDLSYMVYFQNRKAQSLYYLNFLKLSYSNVLSTIPIAKNINDQYELATCFKTLGFIYERKNMLDSAEYFLKKSIQSRSSTNYNEQIVNDYVDLGNFYLNNPHDYKKAKLCYEQTLSYIHRISNPIGRHLKLALVNTCLGETFLVQRKYEEASKYFLQSFTNLQINLNNNLKNNPASIQVSKVSNKDLVIILMNDKTNLLLEQYKTNHDKTFLTACIQTAIVTDSIITEIRHEQSGEQSKLYWRDKTRDFYNTALEACYRDNNPSLAYYFMEKSRAVLLNDKLNELSASTYLSPTDAAKQENYQIKIVELEQKLGSVTDTSKQFKNIQQQLLDAKNDFEHYIKSLEQKYPAYYQYKYADEVPSLQQFQLFLKKSRQDFVYYFFNDTATYILAITPSATKLLQRTKNTFDKQELSDFLNFCANKEALNNHYNAFAALSNSIYKKIFQPLQLPKGNIIICADNIIIPFDALCKDKNGKNFLLYDYNFSYVYSARYLINPFNNSKPAGNFLGFAPVSFAAYLNVPDLKNAAKALKLSAAAFSSNKLFTYQNATRKNFFKYAASYSIVSIFSHARADTTDNEPVLFMQDSLIHLSELQFLNNPATKLVLLSACQTNVGKVATGEGIYSLARGFASAGISSVAATLWKADEQTVYIISEKFNQYLSEGMNKDKALQMAKLYFIKHNNNSEKLLPYYWANMILIGNIDTIQFTTSYNYWWWIAGSVLFITALIFLYVKRRKIKF